MPMGNDPEAARARAEAKRAAESQSKSANEDDVATVKEPDYEPGLTPLEFILRTMRDRNEKIEERKDAAKLALPYAHSRLSPIAPRESQETERQKRYREVADSLARKIAEFRAELEKGE
jgi:hypothetical protein